jgi:hypothetical protein
VVLDLWQGGGIGRAGVFFPLLNGLPQKGWLSWDFLSPLKKEGHCMPFHIIFFPFHGQSRHYKLLMPVR